MKYLNLDIIKKHVKVDSWYHDDDTYLTQLGDVAEQMIAHHLDDKLDIIAADNDNELPMPIIQGMLLLVANLYMTREGIAFAQAHEIPYTMQYLLAPYKQYKRSQL